jgi:hypothetical protein
MKNRQNAEVIKIENKIVAFLRAFGVKRLLRLCNIRKRHGAAPFAILVKIMHLPFTLQSFYQDLINGNLPSMSKDTIYALLNNPRYNWRRFLMTLSATVIVNFFKPLTSERREKVFVLDTSLYVRGRSKRTELLSWVRDHINKRTIKGFNLLSLGWSDGNSFLPLDFVLLASAKEDKRLNGINPEISKTTNGYKRRTEALKKATENVVPMLERAFNFGIAADYLLFDSWFAFPSLIDEVKNMPQDIDVICMLKDLPSIRYRYKGRSLRLGELYAAIKKHRGRAVVKASVIVKLPSGRRVCIIFARARNRKGWVALLSTDLSLAGEEIVRIYGKRCKVVKSHLRLAKEIQSKSYDALIARTTIVFTRYLLPACQQRQAVDERTLDGIFRECVQELKDLTLLDAINRLIAFVIDRIRENWDKSEAIVNKLIDELLKATEPLFLKVEILKSES